MIQTLLLYFIPNFFGNSSEAIGNEFLFISGCLIILLIFVYWITKGKKDE